MAGVLLVFCFLIVPPVTASIFVRSPRAQFAYGCGIGAVVSMLGCGISYLWNLPTGAAVVSTFGVLLAFVALARRFAAT